MRTLGTVETVSVPMCWVDFPQRHLGGTTMLWMPPEEVKLVKFEVTMSLFGSPRRWSVDAVYPSEPLPYGLPIKSMTILKNLITEQLERMFEEPVAIWGYDRIDMPAAAV